MAGVIGAVFSSPALPDVSLTSPTLPGVVHRWSNVDAFAREVADASISAGFHYRFSTNVGQEMGRKIGEFVVHRILQPMPVLAH